MIGIKSGQELNLGAAGVSRALRRAEWVFQEILGIKQRILSATGKE
jgi:hypothetical protein